MNSMQYPFAYCNHSHHSGNANIWTLLTPSTSANYSDSISNEADNCDHIMPHYTQPFSYPLSSGVDTPTSSSTNSVSDMMMVPMLVNISQDNKIFPANVLSSSNTFTSSTPVSSTPSPTVSGDSPYATSSPNKRVKRSLQESVSGQEEWEAYVPRNNETFTLYNQNHQEM